MRLIFPLQREEYMVLYHSLIIPLNYNTPSPPLRNLFNLVKLTDQQLAEHKHHYMLLIALEDN